MIDAVAYMTGHSERPAEVVESDAAYAAAVQALCAAVPAELRTLVLELESAATTWAVALAESYFFGGLQLGLLPHPIEEAHDAH